MATNTPKLNLVKPAANEAYDIDITNANSDKIDGFADNVTKGSAKFTKIAIDSAVSPVVGKGEMSWDSNDQTIQVGTIGGSTLQVGQKVIIPVINKTGSTILNGSFVVRDGIDATTGMAKIKLGLANGATSTQAFLGLAAQDIANDTVGHVIWFGKVGNIDTSGTSEGGWPVGTVLYVSPSTAGKLTKVLPTAPNDKFIVGTVLVQGVAGVVAVKLSSGDGDFGESESNVQFTNLTDKQSLVYDSATGVWKNGAPIASDSAKLDGQSSSYYGKQSDMNNKVDKNAAITGATKTKITYDAKGLVTAGADATGADFALTGYTKASSFAAILATDTVNVGLGKVEKGLDTKAVRTTYNALITTTWVGAAAPYTQEVAISGILSTDAPHVSPVFSSTLSTALLEEDAYSSISKVESGANKLIFTCFDSKPVTAINILVEVIRG